MILKKISLHNFRNYPDAQFELSPHITYIIAPNATGKTNILESVHFLCTGKGIKEEKNTEFLTFGSDETDIRGEFDDNGGEFELRVHMSISPVMKKVYFVQKSRKMQYTYLKSAPPVVLFTPELISVIDGSPSGRREFFDMMLCKTDPQYVSALRNYEQGMRRRNKILEKAEGIDGLREELSFWNGYLEDHANIVEKKRRELTDYIMQEPSLHEHTFELKYEPNIFSKERNEEYFMKEFYQRRTLIGPQRDEYTVSITSHGHTVDTKKYASRGEQRLALLWLTLRQLALYSEKLELRPILLLDDIFSELDSHNSHLITDLISQYQTIITSTDMNLVDTKGPEVKVIEL